MGFKSNKVIGCVECRIHAVCMYCLGILPRPEPKPRPKPMTAKELMDSLYGEDK